MARRFSIALFFSFVFAGCGGEVTPSVDPNAVADGVPAPHPSYPTDPPTGGDPGAGGAACPSPGQHFADGASGIVMDGANVFALSDAALTVISRSSGQARTIVSAQAVGGSSPHSISLQGDWVVTSLGPAGPVASVNRARPTEIGALFKLPAGMFEADATIRSVRTDGVHAFIAVNHGFSATLISLPVDSLVGPPTTVATWAPDATGWFQIDDFVTNTKAQTVALGHIKRTPTTTFDEYTVLLRVGPDAEPKELHRTVSYYPGLVQAIGYVYFAINYGDLRRIADSADVSELIAADRTRPAGRLVAFGADAFVSDGTFIRNANTSAKIVSSCDVFGAFAIDETSVYVDSTHWKMEGHGASPGAEQMVLLRR